MASLLGSAAAAAARRLRTAGAPPVAVRSFASTGKRHGGKLDTLTAFVIHVRKSRLLFRPQKCNFQECKFNKNAETKMDAITNHLEKADEERSSLTKTVKSIEQKQAKPWASVNIKGRPLNLPGPISLFWKIIEVVINM